MKPTWLPRNRRAIWQLPQTLFCNEYWPSIHSSLLSLASQCTSTSTSSEAAAWMTIPHTLQLTPISAVLCASHSYMARSFSTINGCAICSKTARRSTPWSAFLAPIPCSSARNTQLPLRATRSVFTGVRNGTVHWTLGTPS